MGWGMTRRTLANPVRGVNPDASRFRPV